MSSAASESLSSIPCGLAACSSWGIAISSLLCGAGANHGSWAWCCGAFISHCFPLFHSNMSHMSSPSVEVAVSVMNGLFCVSSNTTYLDSMILVNPSSLIWSIHAFDTAEHPTRDPTIDLSESLLRLCAWTCTNALHPKTSQHEQVRFPAPEHLERHFLLSDRGCVVNQSCCCWYRFVS